MNGAPAFFELGVEDADRAREFYSALFGWNLPRSSGGGGYMISASTLPGVQAGVQHGVQPGGEGGVSPYLVLAVDDMDWAIHRVRALGGTVEDVEGEGSEESVAREGRFQLCRDNQGSTFGLHQPPVSQP